LLRALDALPSSVSGHSLLSPPPIHAPTPIRPTPSLLSPHSYSSSLGSCASLPCLPSLHHQPFLLSHHHFLPDPQRFPSSNSRWSLIPSLSLNIVVVRHLEVLLEVNSALRREGSFILFHSSFFIYSFFFSLPQLLIRVHLHV
ncbi:hypothetical protein PMAYCL1PPCAC_12266, partial [Pristionchus mayeri]